MATTSDGDILIQLDDKRRMVLGKAGHAEHRRYLAQTFPDGSVLLKPAHIMTDVQLRYLENPEVMAKVEASGRRWNEDPESFVRRELPARRGDQ